MMDPIETELEMLRSIVRKVYKDAHFRSISHTDGTTSIIADGWVELTAAEYALYCKVNE
jgi:hypothetical protein